MNKTDHIENLEREVLRLLDLHSREPVPPMLNSSQKASLVTISQEMGERSLALLQFSFKNWRGVARRIADERGIAEQQLPQSPRLAVIVEFLDLIAALAGERNAFAHVPTGKSPVAAAA